MTKQKVTLTLDNDVVRSARESTDNLSETVVTLLREFIANQERSKIERDLELYSKELADRVKTHGLFSDKHRKFL